MANRFWVGGSASWNATAGTKWSTTSGTAGGAAVPTAADDVFFDAASGAVTVTLSNNQPCRSVDFTGFTGTWTWTSGPNLQVGDASGGMIKFVNTMTVGGTSGVVMLLATTDNGGTGWPLTFAGLSMPRVVANGAGGKWAQQDALLTCTTSAGGTGQFEVRNGTYVVGSGHAITANDFQLSNAGTKTFDISGATLTTTATSGTVWAGGATMVSTGSTIIIGGASASSRTFAGSAKTYDTLTYTVAASSGALIVTGANTFSTINVSGGSRTLTLPSATTTTVTTFNINGTAGNVVTLNSSTGASAATISKASGTTSVDYLSIQDSTATGGASWYAGTHSTSVSGNTGWTFTAPPAGGVARGLGINTGLLVAPTGEVGYGGVT